MLLTRKIMERKLSVGVWKIIPPLLYKPKLFFIVLTILLLLYLIRNMDFEMFGLHHSIYLRSGRSFRDINITCSKRSVERGFGQNVVSYCFYGNINNTRMYFQGIENNAILVAKYYPGWVMRVYHNATLGSDLSRVIQDLEQKYENLDFCNVSANSQLGNISGIFGMLWRMLPLADITVDVFLSRDLDSEIISREVAAVHEWLDSNLTFHVMRDHPQHNVSILGGMWGARVSNNRQLMADILQELINQGSKSFERGFDQTLLDKIIWPFTDGEGIHHDSFFCTNWNHRYWRPFPTQRFEGEFIGSTGSKLKQPCPEKCRADDSWIFC